MIRTVIKTEGIGVEIRLSVVVVSVVMIVQLLVLDKSCMKIIIISFDTQIAIFLPIFLNSNKIELNKLLLTLFKNRTYLHIIIKKMSIKLIHVYKLANYFYFNKTKIADYNLK